MLSTVITVSVTHSEDVSAVTKGSANENKLHSNKETAQNLTVTTADLDTDSYSQMATLA